MKTPNTSDEKLLLHEFVTGDNTYAIETLIERYRRRIYNYIFMMVRDRALTDDIFQETLIKVITSLKEGRYTHDGKFVSWVLRIAHNQVIDYFRAKRGKHHITSTESGYEILSNFESGEMTAEQAIIADQTAFEVRSLVDRLPAEQRDVILMRHYMDLSFKEIADQTGVSINTALGRMRYALINLRKLLENSPNSNLSLSL